MKNKEVKNSKQNRKRRTTMLARIFTVSVPSCVGLLLGGHTGMIIGAVIGAVVCSEFVERRGSQWD